MNSQDELQQHWEAGECLHVDGIVWSDGRVLLLTVSKVKQNGRTQCVAAPLAETTAGSVLQYDPDAWVAVTSTGRLAIGEGRVLLAGEGAMGNEGFVALEREGQLQWSLFCTLSNPFTDLELEDGEAVVRDGYEGVWRIPVSTPERLRIVPSRG
ncbi:MAG: hypothetical protein DIU78_021050 [Pseudomonadota bacterium]